MVDFAKDIYSKLHGSDAPKGMFIESLLNEEKVEALWKFFFFFVFLYGSQHVSILVIIFWFGVVFLTHVVSSEMDDKRDRVIAELQRLQEEAAPAVDLLESEVIKQMRENKQLTLSNVQQQFPVRHDMIFFLPGFSSESVEVLGSLFCFRLCFS